MALIDGLISYWKLDETSGDRNDSHGSNHLTQHNTVSFNTGKIGNCADFNAGASHRLTRADNADLSFADDPFTFNLWLWLDMNDTARSAMAKWGSDGSVETCEYALRLVNGGLNWRVGDGTNNSNVSAATVPNTTTWYMVTVYHDPTANQIGIVVDAGTPDTASHSTGVLDGASAFTLGRTGDFDGQYWDGRIDEVGVWGRVLSAAEISQLYASGAGLAYPFGSAPAPRYVRSHIVLPFPHPCLLD